MADIAIPKPLQVILTFEILMAAPVDDVVRPEVLAADVLAADGVTVTVCLWPFMVETTV
jgi:hypothetical protein